MSDYEGGVGDEERVLEWEAGLPSLDDLTPLSQALIPPELASAFSISPLQYRTLLDVNQASEDTLSSLRGVAQSSNNFKSLGESHESAVVEADENDRDGSGSDSRKSRKIMECAEEADSAFPGDNSAEDPSARTLKRPRLVWTPQLHKRFVDAVAHLGIKNAVPKTIMQLMSVDGLTRENVASHLQKYRLYLKRMQGLSGGGGGGAAGGAGAAGLGGGADPATDHLFASSPVPAHFLHPAAAAGRPNSEHYLPFVPVSALQQQHHHPHMVAAAGGHPQIQGQYHHRQVGHFGSPTSVAPANGQFDHPFLARQGQVVHRLGPPVHNGVPGYVEDLELGNAASAGGRKVLTLFPTGED